MSDVLLRGQDECLRQFIGMQHFGEFSEWIRFFVNGIALSAENALGQIKAANRLRQMEMEKIQSYKKTTGTLGHLYAFVEENQCHLVKRTFDKHSVS